MAEIVKVLELFDEKVTRLSDNHAVIFHDRAVSYNELNILSDKCANYINRIYPKEQKIIPFIMDRSIDMVVLIFGIIKSGRAFLPIDSSFPKNRIEYICKNSKINKLFCKNEYSSKFENSLYGINLLDFNIDDIVMESDCCIERIKNDIMYVIYTSGSTGNPKGVLIDKSAFKNFVDAISAEINLTDGKRILAATSISFDISILEIVVSLLLGMTIVLADEYEQRTPRLLRKLIEKHDVDVIQMTPSLMNLLLSYNRDTAFLRNVSEILIGGEPLHCSLLDMLSQNVNVRLYNMYGPTEATIWCSIKRLSKGDEITIGKPIFGNEIYIMNEENIMQPDGCVGEIYISGKQLARGYINNEELTKEKFVRNPTKPGEIMYKTGDKGKILPNGEIAFLGRIDNQVKINGHRIELEEIENVLIKNNYVKNAVVTVKEKDEINKFLCAYYVAESGISETELSELLAKHIPEYMVPSIYVRLQEIPLMQNGKADRNQLREMTNDIDNVREKVNVFEEQGITSRKIKDIICSKIDKMIDQISLENNSVLKNIGVNSIVMVGVIISLENEFGFQFSDEDFYTNRFITIQDLIDYVGHKLERDNS